jgi:hypothetical protein
MSLPIKVFWLMAGMIHRIGADEELRRINTAVASQSAEGYKEYTEQLRIQLGTIATRNTVPANPMDAERDEEGVAFLKSLC